MKIFFAVALLALSAPTLAAQEIRGTVVDSVLGAPVPGSVVQLLNARGEPIARTLTNSRGQYRASLPADVSSVRVLHIGFRPRSVPIGDARPAVTTIDVRLPLLKSMLSTMVVRDNPNCVPRRDRATAMALWEQVRQGLLATVVAREASPARLKVIRYQRFLDGLSSKITSQDAYVHEVSSATRPFLAVRSAAEFVKDGFVADSAGVNIYEAPDADVMIDDAFFFGYCFSLADRDRSKPTQVGLSFSVPKQKAGRVDITGTVWVDTVARELRTMDFRYIGLGRNEQRFSPGGHVEFRRMENGSVLIDRWGLKLVALRYDTIRVRAGEESERQWWELHEAGGELAHATWLDGSTWQAALGTLRMDAKTRQGLPAVGTAVFLEYTNYGAVVDATGEFEMRDILPGPYSLLVRDTLLAKIDKVLRTSFTFTAARGSVQLATVIIPTALDYFKQNCAEPPPVPVGKWEPASLFVRVVTPDGQPMKNLDFQVQSFNDLHAIPLYSSDRIGKKTDREGRIWECWTLGQGHYAAVFLTVPGIAPFRTVVKLDDAINVLKIVWDPSRMDPH